MKQKLYRIWMALRPKWKLGLLRAGTGTPQDCVRRTWFGVWTQTEPLRREWDR